MPVVVVSAWLSHSCLLLELLRVESGYEYSDTNECGWSYELPPPRYDDDVADEDAGLLAYRGTWRGYPSTLRLIGPRASPSYNVTGATGSDDDVGGSRSMLGRMGGLCCDNDGGCCEWEYCGWCWNCTAGLAETVGGGGS